MVNASYFGEGVSVPVRGFGQWKQNPFQGIKSFSKSFSPREGIWSMETVHLGRPRARSSQGFSPREGIWSMETAKASLVAGFSPSFSPREGIWSMETMLWMCVTLIKCECFSPREGIWSMETL